MAEKWILFLACMCKQRERSGNKKKCRGLWSTSLQTVCWLRFNSVIYHCTWCNLCGLIFFTVSILKIIWGTF